MSIIERMPKQIKVDQKILFAASSDVEQSGEISEEWLIITPNWIRIFQSYGT